MSTPPYIALPKSVIELEFPFPEGILRGLETVVEDPVGHALLVPGFTGSKEDFIAILQPLADAGWHAVAIDLPGQGGAPIGDEVSLASLAEAVSRVTSHLAGVFAEGVHVVGHSLGGLVTRHALLEDSTPFASWTALCSGPAALPTSQHEGLQRLLHALSAFPIEHIWEVKEAEDRARGWEPPSEEVHAFVRERFTTTSPALLAEMARILMTAEDRTHEVARLDVPVTVVFGEADDAWPTSIQAATAERLGVPAIAIKGAGHSPAVDQPQVTAEALMQIWEGDSGHNRE